MARKYVPHEGPIVTRAEAKAAGLTRFFTGKPCERGHLSERYTNAPNCIECLKEQNNTEDMKKKRAELGKRWAQENKEKVYLIKKKYADKNKDKNNARSKIERTVNFDKVKIRKQNWNARNPDYMKIYAKNNPEIIRSAANRRRGKEKQAEGTHSALDIKNIFKMQRGLCAYCKVNIKKKYHIDHIVALKNNGSNWPKNLQLLCPDCNLRKSSTDAIIFSQREGRLL